MTTAETPEAPTEPSLEPRAIPPSNRLAGWLSGSLTFTLTWETALLAALLLVALVTRLWGLGDRVMSHDESLHTYFSWRLASGYGYAHNPMMHGPLLFEVTALLDMLFGAS
ncbi:MAG: hypothetical protein M1281_01545, partial [Chloroflexi bacterium]|nr:hypothetical protein [Chloroflexota bacterium]